VFEPALNVSSTGEQESSGSSGTRQAKESQLAKLHENKKSSANADKATRKRERREHFPARRLAATAVTSSPSPSRAALPLPLFPKGARIRTRLTFPIKGLVQFDAGGEGVTWPLSRAPQLRSV